MLDLLTVSSSCPAAGCLRDRARRRADAAKQALVAAAEAESKASASDGQPGGVSDAQRGNDSARPDQMAGGVPPPSADGADGADSAAEEEQQEAEEEVRES